jgi:hypothetical protein
MVLRQTREEGNKKIPFPQNVAVDYGQSEEELCEQIIATERLSNEKFNAQRAIFIEQQNRVHVHKLLWINNSRRKIFLAERLNSVS